MSGRLSTQGQALQALHGEALYQAHAELRDWRRRHGAEPAARVVPARGRLALVGSLVQTAAPALLLLALWRSELMQLWQTLIEHWLQVLGLPLQLGLQPGSARLIGLQPDDITPAPSLQALGLTALATALAWWLPSRWPDRLLPLRVLVRALALVQGAALLFLLLLPAQFPYTLTSHLSTLLNLGYGFLLAVPVLLALGWGVLPLPIWQRLGVPLGVVAYLALLMPHKALLQVWLLAHSSVLHMPVFYVALGPLLDLMVFVALYGWLLSLRPADATVMQPLQAVQAAPVAPVLAAEDPDRHPPSPRAQELAS